MPCASEPSRSFKDGGLESNLTLSPDLQPVLPWSYFFSYGPSSLTFRLFPSYSFSNPLQDHIPSTYVFFIFCMVLYFSPMSLHHLLFVYFFLTPSPIPGMVPYFLIFVSLPLISFPPHSGFLYLLIFVSF